jgi:hypothetical protein
MKNQLKVLFKKIEMFKIFTLQIIFRDLEVNFFYTYYKNQHRSATLKQSKKCFSIHNIYIGTCPQILSPSTKEDRVLESKVFVSITLSYCSRQKKKNLHEKYFNNFVSCLRFFMFFILFFRRFAYNFYKSRILLHLYFNNGIKIGIIC